MSNPPTDPASLNVSISVSGMSLNEAMALMRGMPPDSRWDGVATRPALGPMRYAATIGGLSIKGATDVARTLLEHCEYVSEHGTVPPSSEQVGSGTNG
jgi:hypothetical protein